MTIFKHSSLKYCQDGRKSETSHIHYTLVKTVVRPPPRVGRYVKLLHIWYVNYHLEQIQIKNWGDRHHK